MKRIFGLIGFAERRQTDEAREKYNKLVNLIVLNRF
jgi:hypothetical protein